MKKKLVLALMMVLVASIAFAGFNFSGTARVKYTLDLINGGITPGGYTTTSGNGGYTIDPNSGANEISPAYFTMNFSSDFYKIAFRETLNDRYNEMDTRAQISLYVDKQLKDIGIELPVSLTATVGNADISGFYAYSDPYGSVDDYYDGFDSNDRNNLPIGFDVGYEGFTARTMFDIVGAEMDPVLSVKGPIVDGVNFAASYLAAATYMGGTSEVNLSATADVAKLAGLDFDFDASIFSIIGFGDAAADPLLLIAVTGGKDDLSAYAQYSLNAPATGIDDSGLYAGVGYTVSEIVSVGADSEYNFTEAILGYDAYITAKLGGVAYRVLLYGDTEGSAKLEARANIAF
ncbi:MAG: hypothetical protein AB9828_06670 [Sphaerochaetaceae bacterium]